MRKTGDKRLCVCTLVRHGRRGALGLSALSLVVCRRGFSGTGYLWRCLLGGTDFLGQQAALIYHLLKCWELRCYHPQKGGVQLTPCDPTFNMTRARFAILYDRQGS